MNAKYLAHILRDIFPDTNTLVNFSGSHELVDILRTPEHSIEAWGLHYQDEENDSEHTRNWLIDLNDSFFGYNFADVFLSTNYNIKLKYKGANTAALHTAQLIKPGGYVVLIDCGLWIEQMPKYLDFRCDLNEELKRYYMLSQQRVSVFQRCY